VSSDPPPGPVRTVPDPGFAGDDGRADPGLRAALALDPGDPAYLPRLLAALHTARVLAPVVALLGESGTSATGLRVDKSADIAVPVLVDADEARALPVFSDLAALAAWHRDARPVPVEGSRAAQVALAEDAVALVVDVAGPVTATLPLPELRALAEGRGRCPAWEDPAVAAAVGEVLDTEPAARAAHLDPWAGRDARLTVTLTPGADSAAVAARLAAAVAELGVVRAGVRGVDVAVRTGPVTTVPC
jgi:hypothetical protein